MATIRERLDRIHREVPIAQVLADLGYGVRGDGEHREQQFSCDLHGDGRDSKPSARVYPESSSWYCFACSRSRDAVDTLQAKKPGLDLKDAIRAIEKRYGLPDLPWDDERPRNPTSQVTQEVKQALDPTRSFQDDSRVLKGTLEWVTKERVLPLEKVCAFWEALDQVAYKVEKEIFNETLGRQVLAGVQARLNAALGIE